MRLALLRLLALLLRPLTHRRRPGAPGRILYIKPDHLGDLLLATPVLVALRRQFPHSHLAALAGPWAAPVLADEPALDELLPCPFPGFTRAAKASLWQPYLELLRYGLLLRRGRFDLAIVGRDDHWWGALLALVAGIPLRVGVASPACVPLLSHVTPYNPGDHVTAQGLALVALAAEVVGIAPAAPGFVPYRYHPSAQAVAWAEGWLATAGLAAARFAVIHPGTAGPSKLWPAERWAAVGAELRAAGVQVVLTGGPGEEALCALVAEALGPPVANLAGHTSLAQLGALLARAALVLGVDSGPLHLAAAVGVPTVRLYGPSDQGRWRPWAAEQQHLLLRAGVWCSPCGVFSHCPRGPEPAPCMAAIGVAEVLAAAWQLAASRE